MCGRESLTSTWREVESSLLSHGFRHAVTVRLATEIRSSFQPKATTRHVHVQLDLLDDFSFFIEPEVESIGSKAHEGHYKFA
eukprot:6455711-Amphidinium_carterae.1